MAKEQVTDYSISPFSIEMKTCSSSTFRSSLPPFLIISASLGPCLNHDPFPTIHHSKMRLFSLIFFSLFFMMNCVVDDGSGTISCCKWHSLDLNAGRGQESYDLGQLVTVQGKISVFREQRQLTVDLIYIQTFYLNYIPLLSCICDQIQRQILMLKSSSG